ncbi:hypothetical protein [Paeniglutamicibacter cryotolerans]|uniref:Uncharacterized protein n=1 Tax=Paeniglutamicibacter cryotolerans TaxID=670079 RepID=A0A839QRV7_9MICC|nr:hypothetical protein [Paeniglutamicibacter cryotolerans]MBB2994791.1 hypothetical protein [Paeniglutamicibacter cryotolerans]
MPAVPRPTCTPVHERLAAVRFGPGLRRGSVLLASVLVLGGCGSADPRDLEGTGAAEATSAATITAPEVSWVDFEAFGIGFSHPAQWRVIPGECVGCVGAETSKENKFGEWNMVDAYGTVLARFAPYSASDMDGNTSTYQRTYLETQSLDSTLDAPASFVFEHARVTPGANAHGTLPESTARLMVVDDSLLDANDSTAVAPYFQALQESGTVFATDEGFTGGADIDPETPTLDQAKAFMADPNYALMKQTMLGVHSLAEK